MKTIFRWVGLSLLFLAVAFEGFAVGFVSTALFGFDPDAAIYFGGCIAVIAVVVLIGIHSVWESRFKGPIE